MSDAPLANRYGQVDEAAEYCYSGHITIIGNNSTLNDVGIVCNFINACYVVYRPSKTLVPIQYTPHAVELRTPRSSNLVVTILRYFDSVPIINQIVPGRCILPFRAQFNVIESMPSGKQRYLPSFCTLPLTTLTFVDTRSTLLFISSNRSVCCVTSWSIKCAISFCRRTILVS